MSDTPYYPPLDAPTVKNLDLIRQLVLDHPAYWLESDYPAEIERIIKGWFDPQTIKDLANKARRQDAADDEDQGDTGDRNEYLYQETLNLYKEMKLAKYSGSNEDSMTYFKTAVALQEKLIGFQERTLGMKQVSDYNQMVMNILENVMDEKQRNEFITQLQKRLGK